ncbi:MAG: DUF2309 domain-containing protein, partial [Limisphaerales bacterium]
TPSESLESIILRCAQLLPAQGPIGVFIHHNTLHAFEHETFEEAVRRGAEVFGCEPFLPEERYREELARGRILFGELRSVLEREVGPGHSDPISPGLASRFDIRLAMLLHPLPTGGNAELEWLMAESEALRRLRSDVSEVQRRRMITETRHWVLRRLRSTLAPVERPEWIPRLFARFGDGRIEDWTDDRWEAFTVSALWEACHGGARCVEPPASTTPRCGLRHRDHLRAAGGGDSDLLVHEVLIRWCAAFLDQGIAHSTLPDRDKGFFRAFRSLHGRGIATSEWWLRDLPSEIARFDEASGTPLASIRSSLEDLGVETDETEPFLRETLLALRGWAGMIWHVEQRADRVHHAVPQGSLVEFLAVRLLLDRVALRALAKDTLGYTGSLADLRRVLASSATAGPEVDARCRAYRVFQLAQVLGWTPERLSGLHADAWSELLREIEAFDDFSRRRVFHLAYEHRFRVRTLDVLAARAGKSFRTEGRPDFQAVFCIDEREESIRRHVEEVAPSAETFGAAGFFGVVMYYRGAAAADFVPLCPVVVRPKHWVSESVDPRLRDEERRRRSTRRNLGMALQNFHGGSRRIVSGAFLSASLGLLATVPLVARVVFPRLTARFRGFFGGFIAPPPVTRLNLERKAPLPDRAEGGHGFLPGEMSDIGERILRDIGLTSGFARIVLIFGHGSTSLNNPHESAHDCGACGGGVGGPNARAIAEMLNDPRIRADLRDRGIRIPEDTVFVGALHNTANDDLTYFDVDRVPATHESEFEAARVHVGEAAIRNAHERARRFDSAPLALTPTASKRHMEGRSEDLSQVRPEWGHATNAICIVARRERTRGLFLDRRAFLVSYDPTQDDSAATILARILGAVIPVCSGINLEYYFSRIDSPGWGSGSKLPHNVTGLLGVMDGAMSDLRTGLPWQMVEIHEPVRLLFVIETTPAAFASIMSGNAAIRTMVTNGWVQVAVMDPGTQALQVYESGTFRPYHSEAGPTPVAASSKEWYAGWRDHLEFAEIQPQPQPQPQSPRSQPASRPPNA